MLSDRERRTLARIERHLLESDPDFARKFARATPTAQSPIPMFLLVAGLTLMVLGSVVAAVPVALAGITLSLLGLVAARHRSSMIPPARRGAVARYGPGPVVRPRPG